MNNSTPERYWFALPVLALLVCLGVFLTWNADLPQQAQPPVYSPQVATTAGPIERITGEPPVVQIVPSPEVVRDREFIAQAFPLLSTWNLPDVKPLLSEATVAASTDAQLEEVMSTLGERLGALQYYDPPQPVDLPAGIENVIDETVSLQQYQFMAYYEAGQAEVNLVLEQGAGQQADSNSLYSFNINVPN